MPFEKCSVALVVPDPALAGGVATVAAFLYRVLSESDRYVPEVISLATSTCDRNSVRLLSPLSWLRGVQVTTREARGLYYRHVGAVLTEIEFQRYRSRRILSELLNRYDLVQVVAGTPPWALATQGCNRPVALQVATLTAVERSTRLGRERGYRSIWLQLMTNIASSMEQRALQQPDIIFVENRWLHRYLNKAIHPQRVIFALPGVDTNHFRPTRYQQDGYILSVGRFADPRKNVRLLFEAYHRLCQAVRQPPRLVLVGTAPAKQDWDYAVLLGITDSVKIYQDVDQEELAEFYRGASLFVLSSDEEGLGIVILEAMASGLPVISTRCGGPEVVVIDGITGYLTRLSDAPMLALRMQELVADSALCERMGQAARQVAEAQFSIGATGKVYLETYDALLDGTILL